MNRIQLKLLLTIITLVLGISGAMLLVKFKTKAISKPSERKLPNVKVLNTKTSSHTFKIVSQGTALPRTTILLISEVSGKVVSVSDKFNAGKFFQKNDLLLEIDPRDYELSLAQARLKVAQANLRLQMEEKEATVSSKEWKLLNQGEPTGLQAREPQLAEARATLDAAKATEESALRNLDRCRIRAPFDGMVSKANVRPGQFVSAGIQLGEIFATDVSEVRLPLSTSDLSFINLPKPNKPLNIDKAPKVILINKVGEESQEWMGSIVRSEENVDPINRMVYVVAKVDDPYSLKSNNKAPLRQGTFLKATINGRTAKKIIAIPRTALRGKDRVWIAEDGKLIYRKVKPVYLDENLAIISEGIDSNEQIIVSLLAGVIDGMGIKIED
jgi:RND family efflux transporter MFP subunit